MFFLPLPLPIAVLCLPHVVVRAAHQVFLWTTGARLRTSFAYYFPHGCQYSSGRSYRHFGEL